MKYHTYQVQKRPYITSEKQMQYLLQTKTRDGSIVSVAQNKVILLYQIGIVFYVSVSKSEVIHKLIVNETICEPVALYFFLGEHQGETVAAASGCPRGVFPLSENHQNEPSSSHPFSH